jgi:tRNA(Arg) A34 adenosine deaminase TadA
VTIARGGNAMAQAGHMRHAVALSLEMMRGGKSGPFGAVIVQDGTVIAEGFNQVVATNDPTAHAEVVAIRRACQALGRLDLGGCEIYTGCEPWPMCLGAIPALPLLPAEGQDHRVKRKQGQGSAPDPSGGFAP